MLKITRDAENVGTLRVNLCGRFTSEYIPEVRKALSPNGNKAQRLALDLTNVTFVDRQAMEFLTAAKSRNIRIDNLPVLRHSLDAAGSRQWLKCVAVPQKSNFPPAPFCPAQFTISRKSRWNHELTGTYVRTRKLSRTSRSSRVAAPKTSAFIRLLGDSGQIRFFCYRADVEP